ncbi:hypothetical protein [Thaumasiovibrio subtropicus]|uniref:hypothetical protein n=2 Tax=Thaumasiovibrio subtropicus TaxID=1891207 RepID=UPI001FE71E04|nr:hypothetical protein [Thaumasiovibrio subtropicus]
MTRNYSENLLKDDPVIQLAKLIGLESEIPYIRENRELMLPIISGIIVYRQLDHISKRKVLESAYSTGNSKFFGKVQSIIAQVIAKPSWNPWSLSDQELRDFFSKNKDVSDFLSTWFVTLDGKLEAGFVAVAIYQISKGGVSSYLRDQASTHIIEACLRKLRLSSQMTSFGGKAFFVAVILASVLKNFSDIEIKKAREELLNRGLLLPGDL